MFHAWMREANGLWVRVGCAPTWEEAWSLWLRAPPMGQHIEGVVICGNRHPNDRVGKVDKR